jgi:hypothetical protein
MIESDARLVTMLVRAPAPLTQKISLLIKLAMGEAGPTGPVADKARLEALKLARAPRRLAMELAAARPRPWTCSRAWFSKRRRRSAFSTSATPA